MRFRSALAVLTLLAPTVAVVPATASAAATTCRRRPATVTYRTIPGVDRNLTSLDVHPVGTGCDHPVVVWVHGGGYRTGDKRNAMTDKVRWARSHGWVLVSVNYRLTRPGDPSSARSPDHYDDVAAALAWTVHHVDRYGGDPERIAVLGHSAGADIVGNVIVVPDHLRRHGLTPADFRCAGPLDTEGFDKVRATATGRDQWRLPLGNLPDYRTATSATLQAERDTGIPPTIGVVRGTPTRRAIERDFLGTLEHLGVRTTTIDARGLSHAEVNRRIGAPGDTVMTPPLTKFLTRCFRG
jgi:arylformamidase